MDDYGIIPQFLVRHAGDTRAPRQRRKVWKASPSEKQARKRAAKERVKRNNAITVQRAIKAGSDTLGKLRTATSLENEAIYAAIRQHNKNTPARQHIAQVGKRYYMGR